MTPFAVNPLKSFELFSRLPNELRADIWKRAACANSRILQAFYNYQDELWQIDPDSIGPNSISNVCREARGPYTLLFDAYVMPRTDQILIADSYFILRGPQKSFLDQGSALAHLAIMNEIWVNIRQIHTGFPTVYTSPAGILRTLEELETFTLTLAEEDFEPLDEDDRGDLQWREATASDWLDETDDEHGHRHGIIMIELERTSPISLRADADGHIPAEAKADRFLEALEIITMEDLQEAGIHRRMGLLHLREAADPEFQSQMDSCRRQLCQEFDKESTLHKEWKQPSLHVSNIESGEILRHYESEWYGYSDADDKASADQSSNSSDSSEDSSDQSDGRKYDV